MTKLFSFFAFTGVALSDFWALKYSTAPLVLWRGERPEAGRKAGTSISIFGLKKTFQGDDQMIF